ncbi:single-stranded DNA-binding protein [Candidatus Atelocyanobacterium thalassae]|uniref:Single-stranded DNA-binding protein n=2 Tax=Candidatus Atelocyanobacterium thalassae TaxID=713887 RepID=A0A086CIJ4_9CHRO|nr:single-stranded DNA-binding protein [Candidatus Atelocyanobacterium thalassa]KFF42008.1 MAG: single-stranded DNA-binding protein [Candidatus Atelocyanobacterium thalassa isolate SIO64986]BDA39822.1 single-stranded DNA-binding protein [cyanobacterium endosymbiont of Braarudosphaera bigelowii]
MNSFVLMAKVISNPELRYTSDTQKEITQMFVEFEGGRLEDSSRTLKVLGWGNLAANMKTNCHEGDMLIIEGRLSTNTFERKEGFKEKRIELIASNFYPIHQSSGIKTSAHPNTNFDPYKSKDDSHYNLNQLNDNSTISDNDDPIPF